MKRTLLFIAIALILIAAIYVVIRFIPNGRIESGQLDISEIEIGSVISTIPAEGRVAPESEVLILSPASSIVRSIVKDVGSRVELGEAMIILDPTPVQEEIEKIEDQLAVKRNSLRKNELNAKSIRVDLDYNVEVKKLRIASLKSTLADQQQLLDVGGISPANYEKTKQELVLAQKDLETLNTRNNIRLKQLETDDQGLKLQISIQEKELEQKKQLLKDMIIRAPSSGIILSLDAQKGEKVNKDKLLITMSNLSEFKIRATSEDSYSEVLKTGNPVFVLMTDDTLHGQVGTISPAIRDRKIEFDVYLKESNHWKLRPNMTLPLRIVVSQADSVMRVKYDPELAKGSNIELYLVEGSVATKKKIRTGLKGDNYIEIRSGVEVGDKVIVSDVSLFRNKEQVELH